MDLNARSDQSPAGTKQVPYGSEWDFDDRKQEDGEKEANIPFQITSEDPRVLGVEIKKKKIMRYLAAGALILLIVIIIIVVSVSTTAQDPGGDIIFVDSESELKSFKPGEVIRFDVGGTKGISIKYATLLSIESKLKQRFQKPQIVMNDGTVFVDRPYLPF